MMPCLAGPREEARVVWPLPSSHDRLDACTGGHAHRGRQNGRGQPVDQGGERGRPGARNRKVTTTCGQPARIELRRVHTRRRRSGVLKEGGWSQSASRIFLRSAGASGGGVQRRPLSWTVRRAPVPLGRSGGSSQYTRTVRSCTETWGVGAERSAGRATGDQAATMDFSERLPEGTAN